MGIRRDDSCEKGMGGPGTAAGQIAVQLVRRYYLHDVGRDSAALTYYLLFALFPLLVFISTLLGILKLDVDSVTQVLSQIVPADVMSVLESYLEYVSANASRQLLWFSLSFPSGSPCVPPAVCCTPCARPSTWVRPGRCF